MGQCINSITLKAAPELVWKTIRDFHDLGWASGVVTSVDKVGPLPGNKVGAERIINKAFHETLLSLDDADKTFSYSIDDGPGPVSKDAVRNYVGKVTVSAGKEPGTTRVDWNSEFTSADDKQVQDFCSPIYGGLLQGLKKTLAG